VKAWLQDRVRKMFETLQKFQAMKVSVTRAIHTFEMRVSDPHPFHADPDPVFDKFADADPDPGCEKFANPDPDPGHQKISVYLRKKAKIRTLDQKANLDQDPGALKMRIWIQNPV